MSYKFGKVKLVDVDADNVTLSLELNRHELDLLYASIKKDFKNTCHAVINDRAGPSFCAEQGMLVQKIAMAKAEIQSIISSQDL